MHGRRNKKLAHLMNAPGIGRSRSSRIHKEERIKIPYQTRTLQNSDENNREINFGLNNVNCNSIKVSSSLLQVLQRNKACGYSPECKDFGQRTSATNKQDRAEYEKLLYEQYGFGLESPVPQAVSTIEEARVSQDVGSSATPKNEKCSQSVEPAHTLTDRSTDEPSIFQGQLSYGDSMEDVKQVLHMGKKKRVKPNKLPQVPSYTSIQGNISSYPSLIQDIHIGQEPLVKVIAEKYVKLKINNIEVRKLEEQIVCLEYDVFDRNTSMDVPIQTMRAYFSVFGCEQCSDDCTLLNELAPEIRDKLKVDPNSLKDLKEKDIEIVNEKIDENRSYVSDLRRVLMRKEALYAKKKKSSLDLNYLYDMAKTEAPSLDYDYSKTNLLSKKELQEVKKLILENREMPTNNISRRTIKNPKSFHQDLNYEPKCRDEVIIMDLLSALEQK